MPAAPRPKGRATKIAMRLLGKDTDDNRHDNRRKKKLRSKKKRDTAVEAWTE